MLVLTGQSTFSGRTEVADSGLRVDGALGGTLHVGANGVLSGDGQVRAVAIATGGRLTGRAGPALHMGRVALGAGSLTEASCGATQDTEMFDGAGTSAERHVGNGRVRRC